MVLAIVTEDTDHPHACFPRGFWGGFLRIIGIQEHIPMYFSLVDSNFVLCLMELKFCKDSETEIGRVGLTTHYCNIR